MWVDAQEVNVSGDSPIRSVYAMPFASPDGDHKAESLMTQALREQL
jgi:hypothetical protein